MTAPQTSGRQLTLRRAATLGGEAPVGARASFVKEPCARPWGVALRERRLPDVPVFTLGAFDGSVSLRQRAVERLAAARLVGVEPLPEAV